MLQVWTAEKPHPQEEVRDTRHSCAVVPSLFYTTIFHIPLRFIVELHACSCLWHECSNRHKCSLFLGIELPMIVIQELRRCSNLTSSLFILLTVPGLPLGPDSEAKERPLAGASHPSSLHRFRQRAV